MYLPIRLAASLPLMAFSVGALLLSLATRDGRMFHPAYGFPNSFLLAFLVTAPGLLLVLPNIIAAAAANRIAGGSILLFSAVFIGLFLAAIYAEARFIDSLFSVPVGVAELPGSRMSAILAANCVLLLLAAALAGRGLRD